MNIHPVRLIILLFILNTLTFNQSCQSNYQYPDFNTNECMPCPTNCLSCFDSFACTACVEEYYLHGNQCLSCQFGCAVCTDANTCSTCINGLYVNADGQCVPCAIGVQTCTIAVVESCKSGYFMLGEICAGCFDHCSVCQDFVTCSLCQSGYYVGPNTTSCLQCSTNCAVCQNATTCTSCNQGYVLNGGTCDAPSCSSISPFCAKCANGVCQQCTHGKYVDSNGLCSQGASLLCYSAYGPYHTNCQTNLYGCPEYAVVQTDLIQNTQLPICLPLHASQNNEYIYQKNLESTCTILSASACTSPFNKTITFQTLKSYFILKYYISLKIYSTAVQDVLVNYLDSSNNNLAFSLHSVNVTTELSLNQVNAECYGCNFGYTIIEGQLDISGGSNGTTLQIQSMASFFQVKEVLIQTGLCKVSRCAACTTAIDCVECNEPYFLQLISCIDQCDPGFYKYGRTCVLVCPTTAYPIQSSYECQTCVSPCLTCSSQTECLSCMDGYFLDGTSCVTTCSSAKLFTNLTSKACETCPNPCTECLVTIINTTTMSWQVSCSGCGIGYLLQQGNCTYICPTGTFSNYINNKTQCSSCQTGCAQCSIAQNICLSCTANYLLDGSTCLMNYICPLGHFSNPIKNSCDKCHFPCLTCQIIGTNCTSCLKGALYNNTCPIQCPTGMYINYSQNLQVCQTCSSPCVSCLSSTICLTCITGTFLYNNQCPTSCPVLTYYAQPTNNTCMPCVPPCLQCLSSTQCLSCTTGYVDLSRHRCTLQCNATSYPDVNFVCQLCVYPCIQCYSATTCSMCALPWVMYNETCITAQACDDLNRYIHYKLNYTDPLLSNQSAKCLKCTYPCTSCLNSPIVCKSCAAGYIFVRDLTICVQQCPQSYYSSTNTTTNTLQCYKCNSNCLNCNIISTNCTQCGTSMYLYSNNTCLLVCPAQYYGSNQEQICKKCQLPCLECYNAYLCKSCVSGIFYNKACVNSCPVGSLHNFTSNACDLCTNNCLSCSVITSNCTQCSTNGYYFYSNQCLTTCPKYFYPDDLSHNCQPCIQPCLQCTTSTQCINCQTGYYLTLYNNRCNIVCPQGFYTDISTSTCLQCNMTICRTCSMTANNCTQCSTGYYYSIDSQSCVQVCPTGTYPDDFYLQCRQCEFPCIACTTTTCITCLNTYKLYSGFCYSECPLGYYATPNNSCSPCQSTCQICSSPTTCIKCISGYYVNSTSACVTNCQVSYYKGYDLLTSYPMCKQCPVECAACVEVYNCTQCIQNYYAFNGICVEQCPALYFAYNNTVCRPCPKFCNTCINQTSCFQCVNSYKYKNLCYPSCPATTYTHNQQICIDCTHPCNQCTSQFSCINCIKGYSYFQNYCVEKCPDDVWKYPETNSCAGTCPYNKYRKEMKCYRVGCGGMLVHLNGQCLDECPTGYYVDQNQNCIQCSGQAICQKIMTGELQILRSYNLRACIYFSQLITPQKINPSQIQTKIYNKNTGQTIPYTPTSIKIDDNMIMVEFGYRSLLLHVLEIKIPYIVSRESLQSVSYNLFRQDIYVYNNYQYEENGGKGRLLESTFNVLYKPSTVLNAIGVVIVSATFVCLVINIVAKGTHYRQLVDFLQFIAATIYLQIQFPPILEQYLKNIRMILFSFLPQLTSTKPYLFSPSKFIEYHKDSSILRTQGILLIIFLTILLIFTILILINKYKPHLLRPAIRRIKYRNICDLFSVVSLPLLVFCFRFSNSTAGDVVCSIVILILIVGFLIFMSYVLLTVKNLQSIQGLAGQLQATANPLGHMYTPFSFIRKIIFGLVLCIQPTKPISTLTLLLIFTILIMVCLYFYQPFDNQITDYICIFMEIILILYVVIVMLFGLNITTGSAAHYMGIVAVVVSLIGGTVGLGWLIFLSFGAIQKWRKQSETSNQNNDLQQNLNSEANPNKSSAVDPNSANKITGKDIKDSEYQQSGHKIEDEEASAAQLVHGHKNGGIQRRSRFSKGTEQLEVDFDESQVGEQFKHWNNSQSDKNSSEENNEKAPKYLLKMQKNKQQQQ